MAIARGIIIGLLRLLGFVLGILIRGSRTGHAAAWRVAINAVGQNLFHFFHSRFEFLPTFAEFFAFLLFLVCLFFLSRNGRLFRCRRVRRLFWSSGGWLGLGGRRWRWWKLHQCLSTIQLGQSGGKILAGFRESIGFCESFPNAVGRVHAGKV